MGRVALTSPFSIAESGVSNKDGQFLSTESLHTLGACQGHSSLDAPSELNPPQRIPSLLETPLVPQAKG